MPLDEGAEQVDAVGGGDLGLELGAEGGLVLRVGQQRGVGERHGGPRDAVDAGRDGDREELLELDDGVVVVGFEELDDAR